MKFYISILIFTTIGIAQLSFPGEPIGVSGQENEEIQNYTLKQKITHRIIKIFQEIDRLGTR